MHDSVFCLVLGGGSSKGLGMPYRSLGLIGIMKRLLGVILGLGVLGKISGGFFFFNIGMCDGLTGSPGEPEGRP